MLSRSYLVLLLGDISSLAINAQKNNYNFFQVNDTGYKGAIRPDHVPTMFGDSNERPEFGIIGTLFSLIVLFILVFAKQKPGI